MLNDNKTLNYNVFKNRGNIFIKGIIRKKTVTKVENHNLKMLEN